MRGMLILAAIVCGLMPSAGRCQSFSDFANFRSMSVGGVHLYGISFYSGYSTSAYPGGFGQPVGAAFLGPDVSYGGTATMGWQRRRGRSNFSVTYSLGYGGLVHYSDANAFSQSISLSLNRQLGSKWTLSLSGNASDSTMAQYLYQPSNLGVILQMPVTMDDLAAAFSIGQFSSSEVAAMLTGAPTLESPLRPTLLGDRILSYSGAASLSYAHSSRLNFYFSGFTAAGQHLAGGDSATTQPYVIPRSMGVNAGAGFSYMLSPRTDLSVNAGVGRTFSSYQDAYVTTANVSIGRKMGAHWFMGGHVGGAISKITSQTYGAPRTNQMVGGGNIGFRTYRHALVGAYERSASGSFALAVGVNTTISAGWNWHRPGSQWSVFTSFAEQQFRNNGFASLSGWEASGGIAERLNAHSELTVQYVYLTNTGNFFGNFSNFAVQSIRMAVSWTPTAAMH